MEGGRCPDSLSNREYIKNSMKTNRFIVAIAGLAGIILCANAQSKFSFHDQLLLDQYRFGNPIVEPGGRLLAPQKDSAITVIVTVESKDDVEKLKDAGFIITKNRGTAVIMSVPSSRLSELSEMKFVKKISLVKKVKTTADTQRETTGLWMLNSDRTQLDLPLTGKGVVTGIFDEGFDPTHVNFYNSEGKNRIGLFSFFGNVDGTYENYPAEEILSDNPAATHGTHVLGIMAGSYKGDLEYALNPAEGKTEATITSGENPFWGVAPESDIAISCGQIYLPNILVGIENIIEYATEHEKPAVINLSFGTQQGPHDGLEPELVYLSELGKEAIIVMSSGNDGLKNNCVTHVFESDEDDVMVLFLPPEGKGYATSTGETDVWFSAAEGCEVEFIIYDMAMHRVIKSIPVPVSEGVPQYITTSDATFMVNGSHDDTFDHHFSNSYLGFMSGVHEENNRFNVDIIYSLSHSRINSQSKLLGIRAKGPATAKCDIYAFSDVTEMGSRGENGFSDPGCNGSINNMACADNLIVVGSYNNKTSYPTLSGEVIKYSASMGMDVAGAISGYSSYGFKADGTPLPHVCAPGSGVVSSYSKAYVDAYGIDGRTATAHHADNFREYWWVSQSGTSMSTPFVSGVIALWLQVNPDLDVDMIKDIIAKTSLKDDFVNNTDDIVRWGAGKINPKGGLDYILEHYPNASVNDVHGDADNFIIMNSTDGIYIGDPTGKVINATVHTIDGKSILSASANSSIAIDKGRLSNGIYILTISNGMWVKSIKFAI